MCFNLTICIMFILFNINLSTKINLNKFKLKNSVNKTISNIIIILCTYYNSINITLY